jgi:osmotically-inducible protein OsmY
MMTASAELHTAPSTASTGMSRYSWGATPSIHIIVKHGHVTLVGVVDNPADKTMAEMQARSVPLVFSVEDQLQVANEKQKTAPRCC